MKPEKIWTPYSLDVCNKVCRGYHNLNSLRHNNFMLSQTFLPLSPFHSYFSHLSSLSLSLSNYLSIYLSISLSLSLSFSLSLSISLISLISLSLYLFNLSIFISHPSFFHSLSLHLCLISLSLFTFCSL